MNSTSDIKEMIEAIRNFSIERDWDQFHNGKDLAMALSIEANELLEVFLWKNAEEVRIEKVREELADVFNYALMIADKYQFDVKEIVMAKLCKNAEKYPVEKSRGSAKKYNEL